LDHHLAETVPGWSMAPVVEAYQAALRASPEFADCHYNLALLCEELGLAREAIRHMAQYRRLSPSKPE
jgi:tetratricopeptide (TPR) repeat protein